MGLEKERKFKVFEHLLPWLEMRILKEITQAYRDCRHVVAQDGKLVDIELGWVVGDAFDGFVEGQILEGWAYRVQVNADGTGKLMLKSPDMGDGNVRTCWETQPMKLNREQTAVFLAICGEGRVTKTRYQIGLWTIDRIVDRFDTVGWMAEIENPFSDLILPDWVGQEVTSDNRFTVWSIAVNGWLS